MDRTDFIESRADVVKNIYTLYSYAKSPIIEDKQWALQRFKQGRWYVVEPFGNTLLFAPSRFVGYKNNTKEKHIANHGHGTQTNNKLRELNLYKESVDDYLSEQFKQFTKELGIETNTAYFFIPHDLELIDLKNKHKCYFICPTHCKGQKENAWKSFLTQNIMAIGWKATDYTHFTINEIRQEYIDDSTAIEPFTLIKQIKEGDIICCTNNNHGLWGIGVALSSYKYQQKIHYAGIDEDGNDSYYAHYINVAWLCFKQQGYISTSELNIQLPETQWQPYGTLTQKAEIPQYISNYLLLNNTETMEDTNNLRKYIELLEANKNLILTGAPGTGKTYLAKAIAKQMKAEYEFVQFHPSYDYTDFVEGLRPTPPDKNGNIGFQRKDGVFKEFCKKAIPTFFQTTATNKIYNNTANSFEEAYNLLISAIEKNNIILYSDFRNSKTVLKVAIKEDLKYDYKVIQFYKTNKFQNAQIEYLQKIYNYYVAKGQYDIRQEGQKQFENIIGNTLDYSYYRGIVQGLLDLTDKKANNEDSNCNIQLFEQCYYELVTDINNGIINTIKLKTGESTKLNVSSSNSIKWQCRNDEKNDSANAVTLHRLLKLYSKYNDINQIDNIKNDDIRDIIGGADSTYYWAVLREILLRMKIKLSNEKNTSAQSTPYVFIIDEINRGEISKIFGELFFSIDPGYRGEKGRVKTQYQNLITDETDPFYNGFYVPKNVYIIGTMNDIDRSVESMDFAMRRRFAWTEIKANENIGMLEELHEIKDEAVSVMNRLNAAIWNEENNTGIEGLSTAYHIGGAYFCKLSLYLKNDPANKEAAYKQLWENHLKGVLFEYLRGTANAMENLKMLEQVYYNKNSHDDIEG